MAPPWLVRILIESALSEAKQPLRSLSKRRSDVVERRVATRRHAARDGALVALAGICGLALRELLALRLEHYLPDPPGGPALVVPGTVPRELPLFGLAAEAVALWAESHHGGRSPKLFYGFGPRDKLSGLSMTQRGANAALGRLSESFAVSAAAGGRGVEGGIQALRSSVRAHLVALGLPRREVDGVLGVGPGLAEDSRDGTYRPSEEAVEALRQLAEAVGKAEPPPVERRPASEWISGPTSGSSRQGQMRGFRP